MHRMILACLLVLVALLSFTIGQKCYAKNAVVTTDGCGYEPRSHARNHTASPMVPTSMPGEASGPPMLPGATNGTIGPPSSPVSDGSQSHCQAYLTDLNGNTILPSPRKDTSVIAMILFASFAIGLMVLGIRSVLFKKQAPLWSYGLIAAGALMLAGFMLSFDPEPVPIVDRPETVCEVEPTSVIKPVPADSPGLIKCQKDYFAKRNELPPLRQRTEATTAVFIDRQ